MSSPGAPPGAPTPDHSKCSRIIARAVASVMAALMVLYVVGDILLLALGVILVLLILLGLRNYLPRFINETKLLLNVGAVRERERVIYQGLPWMVRTLGMYSRLYNPALEGLLRVPMSDMLELVSRPYREDEPWFPTQVNDWVRDNTGGKITRILDEITLLDVRVDDTEILNVNELIVAIRSKRPGEEVTLTYERDGQTEEVTVTLDAQAAPLARAAAKHEPTRSTVQQAGAPCWPAGQFCFRGHLVEIP